jgi:hypothetical protein
MCQAAVSIILLFLCSAPYGIALDRSEALSQDVLPPEVSASLGPSVVALKGPWKFHVGDNPGWADPDYDDSSWETVDLQPQEDALDPQSGIRSLAPGWTAKGHPGYSGFAWYRIRVRILGATGPLALLGPTNAEHSYEVFADGRLIGSIGNFRPRVPTIYATRPVLFRLPEVGSLNPSHQEVVLAFRFYMAPLGLLWDQSGGMHVPPVIGMDSAITAAWHVAWEETYQAISSQLAAAIVYVVFALLILLLYAFDRKETILLWPLAACVMSTLWNLLLFLSTATQLLPVIQTSPFKYFALIASIAFWLMTWQVYLGLQKLVWLRNAIVGVIVVEVLAGIVTQAVLISGSASQSAWIAYMVSMFLINLLQFALQVLIAGCGFRQPQRNWFLALALSFSAFPFLEPELRLLRIRTVWYPYGVQVPLFLYCELAALFCFFFVLLQHFRSSQRRQQARDDDIEQAREVQQMIIPRQFPQVPGVTIESAYCPASEVGGDFFQVLPAPDDSLLIVVGDVSGKGLKAAMTVSMIIGALRNESTRSPALLLGDLNRILSGQINGFVTCCAALIGNDGTMTMANAGHLAPYRNGKEIEFEAGLPLGIMRDTQYWEFRVRIAPGDRLTFLSDGVVEAQTATGELFGFDRTRQISTHSADQIVKAAEYFGQQDDITVLTVSFASSEVAHP